MQEQPNDEKITGEEEVIVSDFDTLFEEAKELDVYIPNWVNKRFSNLYKFAYLQVKKDSGCGHMSAAKRTELIKGLMNMYFKKIVENASEDQKTESDHSHVRVKL